MKKQYLEEAMANGEDIEQKFHGGSRSDKENKKPEEKTAKKLVLNEDTVNSDELGHRFHVESLPDENQETEKKKKRALEDDAEDVEEEEQVVKTSDVELKVFEADDENADSKRKKLKKRLFREAAKAKLRGVCYLSRIPPHMDPLKLRQLLSQFGEIQRIYLAPEDPTAQVKRKRARGFRGQMFSEGWVEFADKRVAKSVANMLNGEQIGGRKRSSFYYDLWNIKYLSKFKWDDLTEEIAYKTAIREQKLSLELSAAKRERDLYLARVDKSRALNSIAERLKKKQKVQEAPKVIREFPQTKPVADKTTQSKPRLSKDLLAGVFSSS